MEFSLNRNPFWNKGQIVSAHGFKLNLNLSVAGQPNKRAMKKVKYVTRKQVDIFIRYQCNRLKMGFNDLQKEVRIVLDDLSDYPNEHPNQIKFYKRVFDRLSELI